MSPFVLVERLISSGFLSPARPALPSSGRQAPAWPGFFSTEGRRGLLPCHVGTVTGGASVLTKLHGPRGPDPIGVPVPPGRAEPIDPRRGKAGYAFFATARLHTALTSQPLHVCSRGLALKSLLVMPCTVHLAVAST